MSKINPTTGERMAVIENDIKSIKSQNTDQYTLLKEMSGKVDTIMKTKADRDEVIKADEALNQKINDMQKSRDRMIFSLITLLFAILGFLIRYTLFN